jgi:hypothetical protein
LIDGLMTAGFAVQLANTSAIKRYEARKYVRDERDAVFLERIFRVRPGELVEADSDEAPNRDPAGVIVPDSCCSTLRQECRV